MKVTLVEDETYMPKFKIDRVFDEESRYRVDITDDGMSHPMEHHEEFVYQFCRIGQVDMAMSTINRSTGYSVRNQYTPEEQEFIKEFVRRPEIDWAINNSFDGVYISKYLDPASYSMRFNIGVYMLPEHITFWKLKYK